MAKATKTKETAPEKEAATFRLTSTLLRKVKYIALMDSTTQTDIVEESLNKHVDAWEKKNGQINIK